MKSHRTVRKYVISSAVVASVVCTPIFTGSAFAKVDQDDVQQSAQQSGNGQIHQQQTINHSLVRKGERGQDVKALQAELKDRGYYTYHVDSIFGPITEEAVRDFQGDRGLAVDGIAGPNTKAALYGNRGVASTENVSTSANNTDVSAGDAQPTSNAAIAETAKDLVGTPYKWGGTNPDEGFDSSGLIKYTLEQNGVDLDGVRTEAQLWSSNTGTRVNAATPTDAKVGNVVYFSDTYGNKGGATHSGIYIGNGQMVHAPGSGDQVEKADLSISYWQNHYIGTKAYK